MGSALQPGLPTPYYVVILSKLHKPHWTTTKLAQASFFPLIATNFRRESISNLCVFTKKTTFNLSQVKRAKQSASIGVKSDQRRFFCIINRIKGQESHSKNAIIKAIKEKMYQFFITINASFCIPNELLSPFFNKKAMVIYGVLGQYLAIFYLKVGCQLP